MIPSKIITNPFPGLRPFETDEYGLFFGREGQADALLERLQRSHFLAVVGTSGSGKSSLVRAGLLPALRGGMMAGAGSGWRIAIMRPGSDPIGNLAGALAEKDVLLEAGGGLPPAEAQAVIEATLRRGSLGLVDVARQARLSEHEKLLVVVDQFEELFRFRAARVASSTGDDASAFVKLLLEAAQQNELPIYVVPTMRSDFLGDCAQFQGLPEAINDGQYLIPRMTRDERRFAISGPVAVKRCQISEPLVNRLMNDVGDNPDQLPILQHALMRTWDYWMAHRLNGEPIGLEQYEAIGTMSDALSNHADEAFNELPDERSRKIAETLFKALTERGADNREIRRPTRLQDICDIAGASEQEVAAVVDVFRGGGRSFLMPPAGVALQSETVVDISHESLIRNWRRLKEWVKDEAESARIYRRLAGAATDYRAGAGGLLDDVTLQYVLRWREKSKPDRAWGARYYPEFDDAMAYLEESRVASEARVAAEQERDRRELETARAFAEKQTRSARRMRWLTAALGVILLFALGATGYAFVLKKSAQDNEKQTRLLAGDLEASRRNVAIAKAAVEASQRLAEEKEKTALAEEKKAAAAKIEAEQAKTEARQEKQLADQQKKIAADNFLKAEIARKQAEKNAKQIVEAGERDKLLRQSIQATRRDEPTEARKLLEQLKTKLQALRNGPPLPPDQEKQFTLELGWTLSDIGATYQQEEEYNGAIKNYEDALATLKPVLPEDADDPVLFGTYHGLGHSYHDRAKNIKGSTDPAKAKEDLAKAKEDLARAKDFFEKALNFQKKHRAGKPSEIAGGYLNLARLYADLGNDPESVRNAENNYRLAFAAWKENNSEEETHAVLRELAQFHSNAGRYAESEKVYNELITLQEDITVFDFAEKGHAIAEVYNELADVYRADGKEKEADDVFHVADLIQKLSLKLRRYTPDTDLKLDDDLDEMGDAYLKLGKVSDAEVLYRQALTYREDNATKRESLGKSYDKLGNLYRVQKNYEQAEVYSKNLVELYADKPKSKEYAAALKQLAALYAEQPNKSDDARSTYKSALNIYEQQRDWHNEEIVYFRLSKLGSATDRHQALLDRAKTMSGYFKALAPGTGQQNVLLVKEYLNAINALAYRNPNTAEAESYYRQALDAFTYIRSMSDPGTLNFYATMLEDYQRFIKNSKRPADPTLSEKVSAVRERQRQLDAPTEQAQ